MVRLVRKPGSPYFFINGELEKTVIESLDESISYFVENYERTDKFQSGQWDGKEHLLKRAKNGSFYFPFGLIDRILRILRLYSVSYVVSDETSVIEPDYPMEAQNGKISLRPYQVDALNHLMERCHNSSGVIALPTAAGKTVLALAWLEHLKTDAIVIVHRKELLNQWYDEISRLTSIKKDEIGLVNDTFCDLADVKKKKRVYICMVQSLFNAMQKGEIKDVNVGLLILDEAHTIPAKGSYYVCSRINALYRLGLSATPHRSDNAELKIFAACGMIAENITAEDLVEQGYITKPEFRMINCYAKGLRNWDRWTDVYKKGVVLNEIRNNEIVNITQKHQKEGRQVYIHVSQVAHGKHLQALIDGSVFVYGSTPKKEREEIIKRYKNGEIRILISTLLKEGVSIDGISCLIYAQGMKSEVATIQTIGRALRLDPAFNDALIYDFIDSGHKHLVEHSEQRIMTYREVYGKLFTY